MTDITEVYNLFESCTSPELNIKCVKMANKDKVINGKSATYKQYIRDIFTKSSNLNSSKRKNISSGELIP